MNHSEIAHSFAAEDYGRKGGRGGDSFYSSEASRSLYSYGSHFVIATHLDAADHGGFEIASTNRTYSNATAKHLCHAWRALTHLKHVTCAYPLDAKEGRHKENLEDYAATMRNNAGDYRGKETQADSSRLEAITLALANLEDYRKAFKLTWKAIKEISAGSAKTFDIFRKGPENWQEKSRKAKESAKRAREAREAKEKAKREKQAREALPKWLAGGHFSSILYSLPVALRVVTPAPSPFPDPSRPPVKRVETSHGADVPLEDARKLWKLVSVAREAGEKFNRERVEGVKLGPYTLKSVTAEGNVVIGCHRISFEAMEAVKEEVFAS